MNEHMSVVQVGEHADGRGGALRPPRCRHHPPRLPHSVQPPGKQHRQAERREPGRDAVTEKLRREDGWTVAAERNQRHFG